MKIAAAAYPVSYHHTAAEWQAHTRRWVEEGARQGAELLLFPEYASLELVSLLPAEVQSDLSAQLRQLPDLLPLHQETFVALAREFDLVIVAPSFPLPFKDKIVNRAFVMSPVEGIAGYQDKFMMTRFEAEEWGIRSGERVLRVFEWRGVRFGIQICYDSEFAMGTLQLSQAGAELVLVPSCTETPAGSHRVHIGARARALENQIFTAVAPTIGEASWSPAVDVNFGQAACYGSPGIGLPDDGILAAGSGRIAGWVVTDLPLPALRQQREQGQVLNHRDHAKITCALQCGPFVVEHIHLVSDGA
jgi:predicted amidohydrolase